MSCHPHTEISIFYSNIAKLWKSNRNIKYKIKTHNMPYLHTSSWVWVWDCLVLLSWSANIMPNDLNLFWTTQMFFELLDQYGSQKGKKNHGKYIDHCKISSFYFSYLTYYWSKNNAISCWHSYCFLALSTSSWCSNVKQLAVSKSTKTYALRFIIFSVFM